MLHHLALGARDVAKLADFYGDVFDLPEIKRFEGDAGLRSVWLQLGAEAVLMIERTTRVRDDLQGTDVGAGPFLVAFSTARGESAMEQKLRNWGSLIEDRTEHTIYSRDPEGNRIAVSRYRFPEQRP